jgi:hypothetical protein
MLKNLFSLFGNSNKTECPVFVFVPTSAKWEHLLFSSPQKEILKSSLPPSPS